MERVIKILDIISLFAVEKVIGAKSRLDVVPGTFRLVMDRGQREIRISGTTELRSSCRQISLGPIADPLALTVPKDLGLGV